jgi:hypothetical protein
MSNHQVIGGIWKPPLKQVIRIAFISKTNSIHPILWIKTSDDASVYIGPRLKGELSIKGGSKIAKNEHVRINYNEGVEITDPNVLKNKKHVSFHGSGAINFAGERAFGANLRELKEKIKLTTIMLQHPSKHPEITNPKNFDICLKYPIDIACPVLCNVYAGPYEEFRPTEYKNFKNQLSVILRYEKVETVGSLAIEFVFHHGQVGTWPQMMYFLTKSNAPYFESQIKINNIFAEQVNTNRYRKTGKLPRKMKKQIKKLLITKIIKEIGKEKTWQLVWNSKIYKFLIQNRGE